MTLDELRKKIDILDDEIINLLEKRLKLSQETKKLKKNIFDKKREENILSKIASPYIKEIYIKILKISKRMQK